TRLGGAVPRRRKRCGDGRGAWLVRGNLMFKDEFLAAWRANADYHALIKLVRRHRSQGLSVESAYEVLEQIWLEYGCDKRQDERRQDTLEAVMEKVWYGFVA